MNRVALFAYSLLGGNVLPCLGSVRKFVAASPASIWRLEASGPKRVGNPLYKLKTRSRTVDSCAMLREIWSENPLELHSEILDWFQEGFHQQFEELWSEMHRAVVLNPWKRFPKMVKKDKGDQFEAKSAKNKASRLLYLAFCRLTTDTLLRCYSLLDVSPSQRKFQIFPNLCDWGLFSQSERQGPGEKLVQPAAAAAATPAQPMQ
ncbi:hypothetical protein LguiA_029392 [Lonicera macranthoides]